MSLIIVKQAGDITVTDEQSLFEEFLMETGCVGLPDGETTKRFSCSPVNGTCIYDPFIGMVSFTYKEGQEGFYKELEAALGEGDPDRWETAMVSGFADGMITEAEYCALSEICI